MSSVLQEWARLVESTAASLERRQVADLYLLEWPEAKKQLIAAQIARIEREQKTHRRWLLTASAVLYGLVMRLSPVRRVVFAAAALLGSTALLSLLLNVEWTRRTAGITFGLAAALILMTLLLAFELLDKLRFRDELELARALQAELVPQSLPEHESWKLAAANRIANTVGGDLYTFLPLPGGRLAVLFGDASGHGMTAGLIMAVAHATFLTQSEVDPRPEAVTAALNRILCATGGPRSFFAGVALLLEPDGSYEAIVAGHPPLLHLGRDGSLRARIGAGSYPLGIRSGGGGWAAERGVLEEGDALLLHSDGLAEARRADGMQFGYERVEKEAIAAARLTPKGVVASLMSEYETFTCGRPAEDDVSVALLRYGPRG
jgi:phosphoserine phosphatase RsbU/P